MVAAGRDHVVGWSIGWSTDHFAYEIALACRNHVSDAGNRVEHAADFGVSQAVFLDHCHKNVEDPPDAPVEEDFKLVELGLPEQPCFCSPEEEVHPDGVE